MRYSKAPVSEVIFGISYTRRVVSLNHLLAASRDLSTDYPITEVLPPISDESMQDFRIVTDFDPDKTGEFLLRLRTNDRKWLVQLQGNKVLLNWIRLDVEDVGNYVGFGAVADRFHRVLNLLSGIVRTDMLSNCRYLELTYHDRIEWQNYIKSISDLPKILRFQPPDLGVEAGFNNIFSRFTYQERRVGGYGTLSMDTATSVKNTQLLKFENTLRGSRADQSADVWYNNSHEIQFEQFERIFAKTLLQEWE